MGGDMKILISIFVSVFARDCQSEYFEYTGQLSKTKSGRKCQRWDARGPHKPKRNNLSALDRIDHNFCRNPDNDPKGPWCHTIDPKTRFEYCDIPKCEVRSDCWSDEGYSGTMNTTGNGYTCQRWDSDYPHVTVHYRPKNAANNYCSNPDGDPRGLWCFTTNRLRRMEYCNVPKCQQNITTTSTTSTTSTTITTTTRAMIGFMALPDDSDDNLFYRKPNLVPDYIEMTSTASTASTTSTTTTTTTTTTNKSRRTLGCERMSGDWLSLAEMDGTSLLSEEGYIQSSARVLYGRRVTEEK